MYVIGKILEFRTANFTVIVDAIEEESPDLSWDDTGEVLEKLNRGGYVLFCARARVIHPELGELAADYLGNCIYESLKQFRKPQFLVTDADGRQHNGSYLADMVRSSCREAHRRLLAMRDGLNGLHLRRER